MGTITDMVEAEAARAESEPEPGEPEPGEPDPDDGPDPDDPEVEAQALPSFDPAKLEREQKRHEKALGEVFGGLEQFAPCDDCGALGFVPLALRNAPEPLPHPQFERCETCAGFGDMLTGSRKQGAETFPCQECNGTGYIDKAQREAKRQAESFAASQPAYTPPPPMPTWDPARGVWVDHLGQPLPSAGAAPGGYPA